MPPQIPGMTVGQGKRLFVPKPATRVASAPMTAPNAVDGAQTLNLIQRTMFALPFRAARWRIGFANRNLRTTDATAAPTTPATITGIWTGAPVRPTTTTSGNRWVGNAAATLMQRSPALTVPTDGSRVWSAWISNDAFEEGVEKVIGWGLQTPNTGTGTSVGNGFQGVTAPRSSNADDAATLAGQTVGVRSLYLDVVIEYEFAESVKVVVFVGDSNTLHYVTSAPQLLTGAGAGLLPHESWPMVAGAMGGFAAINLGVGSTQSINWRDYSKLWDRLPATVGIDTAIVSLGVNDLGISLDDFALYMRAINAKLRTTYQVGTVFWSTIPPRGYPDGSHALGGTKLAGYLNADSAPGATTLTSTFSPANSVMTIGTGPFMEEGTVSSVTGSGPYAVTLAAALTNAHYTGERLSQGNERSRTFYNNFLRQVPDGLAGIFDVERLFESKPGSFTSDERYVASDYLHFQRGAATARAALVVGAGVRPLFG